MIWQITANHGGGYQYRLCPINEELTEECFQKHPLDFIKGSQYLQWNNGSRLHIKGVKIIFLKVLWYLKCLENNIVAHISYLETYVDQGVIPEGSTWSMNPIPPRCLGGGCSEGRVKSKIFYWFFFNAPK